MSALSSLLSPGFTALHAIMDDAFTVSGFVGTKYGTFSAEAEETDLAEFSNRRIVTRTVLAAVAQFASKPLPEERPVFTYGTDEYVLKKVSADAVNYLFTLEKRT